jgi:XTP/dITP diphosphohydrolase
VYSARFAGTPLSDERNNATLLERMAGVMDRRAHYYCVIVLMRQADDPQPLIAEGEWQGQIVISPRGKRGFGYDPLFLDIQSGLTGAELSASRKNRVSHRGKAMRKLLRGMMQAASLQDR